MQGIDLVALFSQPRAYASGGLKEMTLLSYLGNLSIVLQLLQLALVVKNKLFQERVVVMHGVLPLG